MEIGLKAEEGHAHAKKKIVFIVLLGIIIISLTPMKLSVYSTEIDTPFIPPPYLSLNNLEISYFSCQFKSGNWTIILEFYNATIFSNIEDRGNETIELAHVHVEYFNLTATHLEEAPIHLIFQNLLVDMRFRRDKSEYTTFLEIYVTRPLYRVLLDKIGGIA